jgi:hypothetical protein
MGVPWDDLAVAGLAAAGPEQSTTCAHSPSVSLRPVYLWRHRIPQDVGHLVGTAPRQQRVITLPWRCP